MPEVTSTVRDNLSARGDNVRRTMSDYIEVWRGFFGDLKERFDLDLDVSPDVDPAYMRSKEAGIVDALIEKEMSVKDILTRHAQEMARINRTWFARVR